MVSTVRSPSRTSTTCEAWLKSLASPWRRRSRRSYGPVVAQSSRTRAASRDESDGRFNEPPSGAWPGRGGERAGHGSARRGNSAIDERHRAARTAASDHSRPLVRYSTNWHERARDATRTANRMRPRARVGRGARIGDHEEREQQERAVLEPVERDRDRLPEPRARPNRIAEVDGEERVGDVAARARGSRPARRGTPSGTRRTRRCPTGRATPTRAPVASDQATTPKLVGLKTCLPRQRSTNLLAIATTARDRRERRGGWCAAAGTARAPEISALLGSNGRQLPQPRAERTGSAARSERHRDLRGRGSRSGARATP